MKIRNAQQFLKVFRTKVEEHRAKGAAQPDTLFHYSGAIRISKVCPIEFVAGVGCGQYAVGASKLGLSSTLKNDIMKAADYRFVKLHNDCQRTLRQAFLEILNLA